MEAERIVLPCAHGSHGSYRFVVSHSLFLVLLLAGTGFCAQPAARKLLPEATVLDRVDGKLLHVDANDTWLFELTAEAKTPDYQLPAGTRFVLLPSATLGQLVADVNDRFAPRYRLAARVTLYRGRNFLLPIYYLPLSKFKGDEGPENGKQEAQAETNQESKIENQQSTDSELVIPPEVLEQLKNQPPLRGPRKKTQAEKSVAPVALDRVLVDSVGRIEAGKVEASPHAGSHAATRQCLYFIPYALGWNLSDVRYELLPCTALEQALQKQKQSLDPIRLNVAGLITEFRGRKYLLLQRAIFVYNYGNFGG